MTPKNIALEPALFERVDALAQAEGVTPDELANEAVRRDLLRRGLRSFVAQNRKDAEALGFSEGDVSSWVDEARHQR